MYVKIRPMLDGLNAKPKEGTNACHYSEFHAAVAVTKHILQVFSNFNLFIHKTLAREWNSILFE